MRTFILTEKTEEYSILYNKECDDYIKIHRNGIIERHPLYKVGKTHDIYIDSTQWSPVKLNKGTKDYLNFTWHNKTIQYHVILAEAFAEKSGKDPDGRIWEENELLEVDHINHIRTDNSVDNLRWVSRKYNRIEGNKYRAKHLEQYPLLQKQWYHKAKELNLIDL